MTAPTTIVRVDDQLQWVVAVRESQPEASREASEAALRAALSHFEAAEGAVFRGAAMDEAARAVAAFFRALPGEPELPELPFIGEPFGGQDGTD